MANEPLKIKTSDERVSARARRRSGLPWGLVGGGLVALAALGIGGWLLTRDDRDPQDNSQDSVASKPTIAEQSAADGDSAETEVPSTDRVALVADDGKSLWVSPTAGEPLELGYLLPGTQLVLQVRVADLLAHAEGKKVLDAFGPWGAQMIEQIREATGAELAEIESLLLGIRLTQRGSLDYACRIHLMQPWTEAELASRLPKSSAAREVQQPYLAQADRACFLPNDKSGKVVVACPLAALPELVAIEGEPPLFPRELRRVLDRTDSARMATLVFAGKFLQISGEKLLIGTSQTLLEATLDFLGEAATATALSLHWSENFFLELRSTVALNERPHRFADLLEQRVDASSDRVEDTIFANPPHPYGRKVLARFPAMLRKLSNYTRGGEEEGLSLLRTYLPISAGHNLLMASELLLNSPANGNTASADSLVNSSSAEPQTLAQRLQQTASLVFPKETLQKSLEILSEDLNVPIEIAGSDLQLEGITKNQSLEIELRNRPGTEILLAILQRANPDRTASGPSDVKQKLVYVLREAEEGRPGAIVVTTRAAAKRRGEKLPEVFEPSSR